MTERGFPCRRFPCRPAKHLALLVLSGMVLLVGPVGAQSRPTPAGGPIDLNSASRDALMELEGIGEVRADAIIRARPFKAKTDLVERWIVPPSLYEKIAADVTVRPAAAPAARPPTRKQ
jgi:DNA uptake protein ComE-like DNA-binding protein